MVPDGSQLLVFTGGPQVVLHGGWGGGWGGSGVGGGEGVGELEQGGASGSHRPCPPVGWLLPLTSFHYWYGWYKISQVSSWEERDLLP